MEKIKGTIIFVDETGKSTVLENIEVPKKDEGGPDLGCLLGLHAYDSKGKCIRCGFQL